MIKVKSFICWAVFAAIYSTAATAAVVDAFDLDVTTPAGTSSGVILEVGQTYEILVSGSFLIASPQPRIADAEYFLTADGTPIDIRPISGEDIGVTIDGVAIDWGDYNSEHVYTTLITGTGSSVLLSFVDIPNGYGDNVGSLQVMISAVPLPASGLMLLAGLVALRAKRRRAV